jgi:hypothetical protein
VDHAIRLDSPSASNSVMPTENVAVGGVATGLVVVVLAVNTFTMPGERYGGDPTAMREEAYAMWRNGHLAVDASIAADFGSKGQFFTFNERDQLYYSKYGIMNAIMFVPPIAINSALPPPPRLFASRRLLLILNLYNVVLSGLIAVLLFRLACLYTRSPWAAALYVLATFYGTFLWHYLRAQSGEIIQVLFFTGFSLHYARFLRSVASPAGRPTSRILADLAMAWIFIGALCLTRISYVLLLMAPWFGVIIAILVAPGQPARRVTTGTMIVGLTVPAFLIAALLGWVNWSKFGSPWLTGYHQWEPASHTLSGNLLTGVCGFLFNPQKSIFVYFPVLVLAMLGAREFYQKYPIDSALIGSSFIIFLLVIGKLPSWEGGWCYGPRYLLFLLPVLAMPYVLVLDKTLREFGSGTARLRLLASTLILGTSFWAQLQVNRLPFFTFYHVRSNIEKDANPPITKYFANTHFAIVNLDLGRMRHDPDSIIYIKELRKYKSQEYMNNLITYCSALGSTRNYYWP